MKSIHTGLLNLLIAFNVFIVFFLLFENQISLPPALQVLGRAHPLLLHFPIVLLVVAWILACFGSRMNLQRTVVERFLYAFLLLTSWSAAITVVAGLFLSKEGGYEGGDFQWHKWTGIGLCFLSATLLWYQRRANSGKRFHGLFFRVGLSLSLIVLLVAGHFGAGLTHGANYLFEPIRQGGQKTWNPETARVFDDLVYPILEAKCLGCHSSSKSKGGLVLSDTASMLQGGENGPALIRGSGQESLIVQRLLLDIDHEHRMPPKGKPQLTPDEVALLEAWITSGADFRIPLSAMPTDNPIHQLASAVYGAPAADTYDFTAADAEVIAKLNTPYRVVRPLAQASPALAISFYGKAFFTEQSLQELSVVGQQVVSLSLSGMPLTESDREALRTFINLRDLTLNETPADDSWSEAITGLRHLRTISLVGTGMTAAGLEKLLSMPLLRKVYVWNTDISEDALAKLQQQYQGTSIERGYEDDGSTLLALNDPVITPVSNFFSGKATVILSHPVAGVELRYTLDGSEPDSVQAPLYTDPIAIEAATVVKVKGYKGGWLSSAEVTRAFQPSKNRPDRTFLLDPPHPRYKGRGAVNLVDLVSGGSNHADGKWLGFHGQRMSASLHFDQETAIDSLGISVKQDYGSHIYPPKIVEVWGGADSVNAQLLTRFQPTLDKPDKVTGKRLVNVSVRKGVRYLRVVLEPHVPIPRGYPAEGNPAWMFMDEVIIN